MRTSDSIEKLAAAAAKAQGEIRPAIKDANNPAYRSKYVDLAGVWDVIRGPLSTHEIAVWQEAATVDHGVAVTTRLAHSSGQWVEFGPFVVPVAKHDAHGVGSATSYAKRYALSAALGVVAEDDDDGNAASVRSTKVVDVTTGQETTADKASAPAGYHYISGYRQNGEWHEAHLLKWDAQGGSLKVSTKKAAVGKQLEAFAREGVPVQADVTAKKNSPGEAYLNSLHSYTVAEGLKAPPPPLADDIDESSIPF